MLENKAKAKAKAKAEAERGSPRGSASVSVLLFKRDLIRGQGGAKLRTAAEEDGVLVLLEAG
jgi:hypothetical protein